MKAYSNFIGGEWVAARSGKHYLTSNPADSREAVGSYPLSGAEDAQAAIAAAKKPRPAGPRRRRSRGDGC